jgi:hypothetical protein
MSQSIYRGRDSERDVSTGRPILRLSVPVNDRWSSGLNPALEPQAAQLLDTVHRKWMSWRGDRRGTVPLKHAYLRKTIPDIAHVRRELARSGVMQIDEGFVPGKKSMGYRVQPEFRSTRMAEYSDAALCRRAAKLRSAVEKELLPVHRWLRGKLRLLDFDLERALAIIAEIDQVPEKRRKRVLTVDDYHLMLSEQARSFHVELAYDTPELSCDAHGRVHTSITRLPAIIRRCLSVDGELLVGLDLKNSQPLFLGLVSREFYSSRRAKHRLLKFEPNPKDQYGRQRKGGDGQPFSFTTTTMRETSQAIDSKEVYENRLADISAVKKYLEVCEQGKLYESLTLPGEDRGWLKKRILVDVMYGDGSYPSAVRDRFKATYPKEYEVLAALKKRDHRYAAWLLQNRESRTFIGAIGRRIMADRPNIPMFTIHDCLVTTAKHIDYVEVVAKDEFAKLGVRPTFTHETYV